MAKKDENEKKTAISEEEIDSVESMRSVIADGLGCFAEITVSEATECLIHIAKNVRGSVLMREFERSGNADAFAANLLLSAIATLTESFRDRCGDVPEA